MNKDTFYSFNYKGFTIHTCQNRDTGKEEISVQWGPNIHHKKTLEGAKRWITKIIKAGCHPDIR